MCFITVLMLAYEDAGMCRHIKSYFHSKVKKIITKKIIFQRQYYHLKRNKRSYYYHRKHVIGLQIIEKRVESKKKI